MCQEKGKESNSATTLNKRLSAQQSERMLKTLILRNERDEDLPFPLSYAQANRHLLHTITAMGIWASPSRLTYAAENSHEHHGTLDIHALPLAEQSLGESVMAIFTFDASKTNIV